MVNLTVEEAEEVLTGLMAYRAHLVKKRDYLVTDSDKRQVQDAIVQVDRIVHTVDVKMQGATQ